MTLQDQLIRAFVEEGEMTKIVKKLTKGQDVVKYHLEEPIEGGHPDVLVRTNNHRLVFEFKTDIVVNPSGEIHLPEVHKALHQLKKYERNLSGAIIAVVIPHKDANEWASSFSHEGFWVITWSANRIVRCPRCKTERTTDLVAPNYCRRDYCGYSGPFEQVRLEKTQFILYGASPPYG